jgi:DNA-binding helix-hairpin-helix protein with protein kinase domain
VDVRYSDGGIERCEDARFARGAQGEIYRSLDGRHVVKLYRPDYLEGERQAQLERQLDKIIYQYNAVGGDAYWDALYAWPDRRVTYPRLGVRMRLVSGMTSLDHFFFRAAYERLPRERRGWWVGRVTCAIKLARAVNRLHAKGLCHSDLSERNVVVDAQSGKMTLLDCDSLVVPGELPAEVLGTPEYMAPELHSGKIKEPSVFTDRHALAVLLYRWLLYKHPLLGPKHYDPDPEKDEWYALGERALFIENPTDTSNRPPHLLIGADTLTPRVRELFHKAFVEGLTLPTLRPSAEAWENTLVELYDRIVPCANAACAQRFFAAPDFGPLKCPLCQTVIQFPDEVGVCRRRRWASLRLDGAPIFQ